MSELNARPYYTFEPGEILWCISYIGSPFEVKVVSRYTSDMYKHIAKPHKRYVVQETFSTNRFHDLAEFELVNNIAQEKQHD